MWEQTAWLVILNYVAVSFAIVVTLLGAERIVRRATELRSEASRLFAGAPDTVLAPINLSVVPLIATAAISVAFAIGPLIEDGWAPAVLRGATWLVVGLPIWTFLAIYAALQLGLNRLGRAHLRDDASLIDPSVGLRPFGALAFTASGFCSSRSSRFS